MRLRAVWLLGALTALGCRAQVIAPDAGPDLAAPTDLQSGDGGGDFAAPIDLAGADLRCAGPLQPEVCDNGCDDDQNGYTDGDDPACTLQVLFTAPGAAGSPNLQRLFLDGTPRTAVIDGNPVPASFAGVAYRRAFSPSIYLTKESSISKIRRIDPSGGASGTVSDFAPSWQSGVVRDVCTFNGELIAIQRVPATIHRFKPDGQTEIGMIALGSNLYGTSCSSDGNRLYVSVHDTTGMPSVFVVLDKSYASVATIPIPDALLNNGLDRCLDFAFTQRGFFVGLFAASGASPNDAALNATQVYPFAFDGGVGAPIDAGLLHGIGEFAP